MGLQPTLSYIVYCLEGDYMKIAIHSDLHTEFGHGFPKGFLEDKDFDVLVLAGDFSNVDVIEPYLQEVRSMTDKPILFVPGNHDFYSKSMPFDEALIYMVSVCEKFDIEFMYQDCVEINGVRFVGCTGWPNMKATKGYVDEWDKIVVKKSISDFHWIKNWSVDRMLEEAEEDYKWLRCVLSTPHPKTVVITHYPPSFLLDSGHFPISSLTNYFYNDYPEFFETENKPKAWIYGHTHFSINREINGVQCYSNQLGYKGERTEYSPNYIVEV